MDAIEKPLRITFWGTFALVLITGIAPVAALLFRTIWRDGQLQLTFLFNYLLSTRHLLLMRNSMILSLATTFLSGILGTGFGILFARTDLPLRTLLAGLLSLPLIFPPYITAINWFYLTGRTGWLAPLLEPLGLAGRFTGIGACVWVLTLSFSPIVMLLVLVFLRMVDPELEDAALLEGNWRQVLRYVTLPRILPGIVLGIVLVFLMTLGEFSVPLFYRTRVFAQESFIQFSAFLNERAATAVALPLGLLALAVVLIEERFLKERIIAIRPHYRLQEYASISLGRFRFFIFAGTAAVVGIFILLPLIQTAWFSGGPKAYIEALNLAGDSIVRSILFGILFSGTITAVGFPAGYFIHHRLFRWKELDTLTVFLFVMPGTVLGIGLICLWNRAATDFIYSTPLILLFGLLARYLVLSSRTAASALHHVPEELEESARLDGASWRQRLWYVVLPALRPGLMGGFLLVYLFVFRDLGISMTVYPAGYDTLPIRTFTLMANSPPQQSAALTVVTVGLSLPVFAAILGWIVGKKAPS